MTLSLFAPRPGRFPDGPPKGGGEYNGFEVTTCAAPTGLGAGGRTRQEIYADEYGIDTWVPEPVATVCDREDRDRATASDAGCCPCSAAGRLQEFTGTGGGHARFSR